VVVLLVVLVVSTTIANASRQPMPQEQTDLALGFLAGRVPAPQTDADTVYNDFMVQEVVMMLGLMAPAYMSVHGAALLRLLLGDAFQISGR
jgi:hypothetical protein